MGQWASFWKVDVTQSDALLREALVSHIITSKHAALLMIRERRGLIVEVTENDVMSAGGNPLTQTVKVAQKTMALNMAAELYPYGVAAIAITPGFLRSERMLEHFGVEESNWRDGAKKDKNFLESESPLFVGLPLRRWQATRGAHSAIVQLLGGGARVRLDRYRRSAARVGRARHRFLAPSTHAARAHAQRCRDSA